MIHRSQLITLFLFVSLIMGQTGWSQSGSINYTLTSNGIGPVQLGVNPNELPESIPGLYASKSHSDPLAQYLSDDEDDDWGVFEGWEFLDEEGETVFTADVDSLGLICEITISSPNFLTAEGLHVGSLPQQVETVKGAQKILPNPMADYGRVSYQLNGITLWIDDYLIDDDHSEERVAQITIPAEDIESPYQKDNLTIAKTLNYYAHSSSLSELESHIPEIRQIDGVENVYSNGNTTLFVDLAGSGTVSFSFFPAEAKISERSLNDILNGLKNIPKVPYNVSVLNSYTIAFQMKKDKRHENSYKNLKTAKQLFQKLYFTGTKDDEPTEPTDEPTDPTVEFFMNDIYNYDYVFLDTHGYYRPETSRHYLATSTEVAQFTIPQYNQIKDKIEKGEIDIKILNPELYQRYKNHWDSHSLDYGFLKEQRATELMVAYVLINEDFITSSQKAFPHRGHTIIFNTACQSLMGGTIENPVPNFSLAEAFGSKHAGAYLGFDNTNNIGDGAGLEFFGRLLSGMSISRAMETMDAEVKSCSGYNEEIKLHYTANLRLYCPFIKKHFRILPYSEHDKYHFKLSSKPRPVKFQWNGEITEGIFSNSIKDTAELQIPLHYFKVKNRILYENDDLSSIQIAYGFQYCKNEDFKKEETFTVLAPINQPVNIINEINNEPIISIESKYDDNTKQVTAKLIIDLPQDIFWDKDKEHCYRRPIVMDGTEDNLNIGSRTHLYLIGGPSDPNRNSSSNKP